MSGSTGVESDDLGPWAYSDKGSGVIWSQIRFFTRTLALKVFVYFTWATTPGGISVRVRAIQAQVHPGSSLDSGKKRKTKVSLAQFRALWPGTSDHPGHFGYFGLADPTSLATLASPP